RRRRQVGRGIGAREARGRVPVARTLPLEARRALHGGARHLARLGAGRLRLAPRRVPSGRQKAKGKPLRGRQKVKGKRQKSKVKTRATLVAVFTFDFCLLPSPLGRASATNKEAHAPRAGECGGVAPSVPLAVL